MAGPLGDYSQLIELCDLNWYDSVTGVVNLYTRALFAKYTKRSVRGVCTSSRYRGGYSNQQTMCRAEFHQLFGFFTGIRRSSDWISDAFSATIETTKNNRTRSAQVRL